MINREVRDLIFGIVITAIVIFFFSFSGKQKNLSTNVNSEEIEQRTWIIKCRESLFVNESQFNAKVDKIFYKRHSNLKRSLTLESEDSEYRTEWNTIAESILKQNKNFNNEINCINKETIN